MNTEVVDLVASAARLVAAVGAGALIALGFLWLLRRWTQRLVMAGDPERGHATQRSSSPLQAASPLQAPSSLPLAFMMVVRLGLVIGGFAVLIVMGDAQIGLAALAGFLVARALLLRRLTCPSVRTDRKLKAQQP